ncbi:MAG TPA: glycosyl hydrolase family 8 [Anaeromyxobacteraceae bacterium]|nr:glycosyl hydrolase family 8 [Anaeromyxobacteraceae bacterium]
MLPRGACLLAAALLAGTLPGCGHRTPLRTKEQRARELDELSAVWSAYRWKMIEGGRVVARDEGGITTSEGQSYALLRAVWADDRVTFEAVWRWTREHLQTRPDRLLAWKWANGKVVDSNSATDADTDVALALVLAARRFDAPAYQADALALLDDLWRREVVATPLGHLPVAGNWAAGEAYPTVHVAYLAPYAYEVFAGIDARHPWRSLVRGSYALLRQLYLEEGVALPPDVVWLDRKTGRALLQHPATGARSSSGYDAVPLFWRLAVDARWWGRAEGEVRRRALAFFAGEWRERGKLLDRHAVDGRPLSKLEGWPHLASVHALALEEDPALAGELRAGRLEELWEKALAGEDAPYYLQNWLWFDRALDLEVVRHGDEFLGFLRPFDAASFLASLPPWPVLALALALLPLATRLRWARAGFLAVAAALSGRYLLWRLGTLNAVEPGGPIFSGALWLAEAYAFSTVMLLAVQVGLGGRRRPPPPPLGPGERHPSVDVLVPIYSESLQILDRTLTACAAMRWPEKRIWVCDDGHRQEVAALAAEHGAGYLRGPRRHAKAGNLNAALERTSGELVVVFDTDHLPVASFLERTAPHFRDARMGVVQTPHHFYNEDVFQRAFRTTAAVPNEQDLFNHAIQGGRDAWGGAFFVGSGALFRREALASVGGFNLLSITEDIHTSQKLHAKGWRSAFVDEDLAAGLAAEDVASYLVQRRRWMLGCLQILLRDNPLLERGLPLRHRLGYFASLWYFLFPLPRFVFWATPLLFLLLHLHPLFADVSVLLAYLLPHLAALRLASALLVRGWPRGPWGTVHEAVVSFPLLRAMLDLVLPQRLGFKVTPKGLLSERRRFDARSTALALGAAALSAAAVAKGAFELAWFGIEKDAYAFNLGWASANLVLLAVGLVVAWERPQRRREERLRAPLRVRLAAGGAACEAVSRDVSLSGMALDLAAPLPPGEVRAELGEGLALPCRVVRQERSRRAVRVALAFDAPSPAERRALVRLLFSRDDAWAGVHERRARFAPRMAWELARGVVLALVPDRPRRRGEQRVRALRPARLVADGAGRTALVVDRSAGGVGIVLLGRGGPPPAGAVVPVLAPGARVRAARVVYARRLAPGAWRVGLALDGRLVAGEPAHAYLAA